MFSFLQPQNIEERLSAEMDTSFSVDSDEATQALTLGTTSYGSTTHTSTCIDTTKAIKDIQYFFLLMYIFRRPTLSCDDDGGAKRANLFCLLF
ncbi:hypothetical protein CEXT_256851 [Caerostris extrusa]|uniref:Uncharacterized protein n=1 Tax=Caerostris extrusa TaxID=172846 RepID=A0AAV4WX11_CAEEX|nr:hypothetical protein CEXT_256851 [Caerostris extrusa]